MSDASPEELDARVLVLAPTARDAAASRDLLAGAGVGCSLCAAIGDVAREIGRGAGAALVTAEAVLGDTSGRLAEALKAQPPWSDLPLIVLTPPGPDSPRLLRALDAVGPMTLMKRPVQVSTLVSVVRAALRDRRRQYAVRDLLAERQRAADALRAERERYRVTLASIGDAVIATDTEGRVTFQNGVAESLTGWSGAAGRPLSDVFRIVNEHTRRPAENPALRALREGATVGLANHTVLVARDGTERPIDDSAAPIRDGDGAPVGAVLVFRDVSDRKLAEDARARLTETLRLALDAGELGTWEWDPATDVMTLSDRAGAIYGVDPNRTHRREALRSLLHPDHRERAREAAARAVADRSDYDVEYPLAAGRWVAARGRGVYGPDGALTRMIGVVQDVTARKEAERALRASEGRHRVLAELAAATQPLTDPAAIMAASARLLAEHLGADRCAYAEVEGESVYVITGDYARGVPSIVGRWPVPAFGAEHYRMMRGNEPYVVTDADADPRIGPDDLPAYRATDIRAVVCVPLHKEGKFTAAMAVHQTAPRRWTPDEVELVTTAVGRCWEALERARVERTLRESEARYRAIVEATPDCVKLVAPDGTILQMNKAGLAMVEGDESVLGRCVYDLVAPEDRARFRAFNERVCRGERGTLEFDVVGLRGTRRHMETAAVPLPSPRGGFAQLAVTRDATERRRAEAALRERDERLQLFLENATDYAVVISDPDDRVLEWLGGADRITGWQADEVLGRPVGVIFTAEDRAAGVPERETARAAETGRAENTRWHQRKDGSRFFAEGVTVSVRGPGGELRGFGKVFRDATAEKLAEERLTRDAMLLANVHDAVVVTDLEGVVTYWNEGATRLFGWTAEEMTGRPYADRFPEPVRSRVAAEIRSRAAGSEWSGEYEDYRKDGSRVWIDARVTRVTDAAGAAVGILGLSHDITERKWAEEALREADRKKDDFIALLAHELRNPLAPIRNGLQVIRLSEDPAVRERYQRMMDRQLAHMVRMIDDLLDVSRIGRNKMELRRARVTLAEVVASAVETARPAIDEAGHELTVSLPPGPVVLDADLTRLSQVFSNLLTNSAKYTGRGGRILLSAERTGGAVAVTVRDNGIGIPAESLPRIFDMFSQVDRSTERSTGGLGIGLALVKGLAEMHGGTVSARSEGQGRGSAFTVTLPVPPESPEPAPAPAADDARASPRSKWRVLVVDDNRDGADSMAEMLLLLGNEVATAHDGLDAVEQAERFRPDVVLMDIGMPRLNGLDATRRIREQSWGKPITVIALTGWGQEGDRERSREAGCDGHLVKPVNRTDLEKLLGELRRG